GFSPLHTLSTDPGRPRRFLTASSNQNIHSKQFFRTDKSLYQTMRLDRFQHQTDAPSFSPDTRECPFFAIELASQNSTQMDQVKLLFFTSFLIHSHHFPSIQVSTSAISAVLHCSRQQLGLRLLEQ
uniref:Uncharacterized protein n=1 Tax=Catharus ustulatus TaxID=91951 RepID=A0A8C3Y3D1_CATUS